MESQRAKSSRTVLHIFAVFRNLTCRNVAVYSPALCNLLHQDECMIRAQQFSTIAAGAVPNDQL